MTLFEWLQASGIELPDRMEAMEAGVATALSLAMLAGGVVAGRRLGPRIAQMVQRFAIAKGDPEAVLARATQSGDDVAIAYDREHVLTLKNVLLANLHASDIHIL